MPTPSKAREGLAGLIRQAVASAVAMGGLLLVVAAAIGHAATLGDGFVVKTLLLFACTTTWLGIYLPDHLPHARLGPANLVTLGRLALTGLLGGLLGESSVATAWLALGTAALVLALDGVDGWLARRGGWASAFGARFDMETDALLILLMAALAWQLDKAGAWVLLSGALRYLFVAAGLVFARLKRPLPCSRRRKLVCVLQVLSLLLALAPVVPMPWSNGLAAAGLLLLCYSFLVDIVWLSRQPGPLHEEPINDEHH